MKAIITNGQMKRTIYNTKTLNGDPWDADNEDPRVWIGGQAPINATQLVPAVYAAWQARCKAMADLPFTIYDKGDKPVDSSDDYKNKTGVFENPRIFLWLAEAALCGYGKAYWLKKDNEFNFTKGLQYFRPDTITAKIEKSGLTGFTRDNNGTPEPYLAKDLLYIWLPDPSVELGPPNIYPLASALVSAGALDKINYFVKDYMERGAVKAMILSAKNMPDAEEAKRVEKWFNGFMRGAKNLVWKMFNADEITPTIIGEGLEAFKGVEITTDLIQQINTAFGTRQLMEDENYATAMVRQREFYTNTIMPDARLISDGLNTQVLNKAGYRIEFNPEELECFQEDEVDNGAALAQLVNTFIAGKLSPKVALPLAMEILGYDLTDDQMARLVEGLKQPEPVTVTAPETQPEPDTTLQDSAQADMAKWLRKASKNIGKDVSFVSENIPASEQARIHAALPACKTADDVRAVFEPVAIAATKSDTEQILEGIWLEVKEIKSQKAMA